MCDVVFVGSDVVGLMLLVLMFVGSDVVEQPIKVCIEERVSNWLGQIDTFDFDQKRRDATPTRPSPRMLCVNCSNPRPRPRPPQAIGSGVRPPGARKVSTVSTGRRPVLILFVSMHGVIRMLSTR